MRDDFTKSVKDTLSKRVALRCSNPNCRKLTAGPNSDEEKATNIGVAAHITAASQGGPRYNELLTTKQRKSIDNAIWLCQSCAKLVDNDEVKYPEGLLKRWKIDAEESTELELTENQILDKRMSRLCNQIPDLLKEMANDMKKNPLAREFILLSKHWVYGFTSEILVYYYEDHENLDQKIKLLENNNFVEDISYNNTKRYVFEEDFVEMLNLKYNCM
jgi:hypothetical protein